MRIGFDAKRAFFNRAGLGNYSRDAVTLLSRYYPENEYVLYTPHAHKARSFVDAANVITRGADSLAGRVIPFIWRRRLLARQIESDRIDLYHGITNELPSGIEKTKVKSVVSIADLIFIRYPQLYYPADRLLYTYKFKKAARISDRIIAISQQTKNDIVEFFGIPDEKVDVVYLNCNSLFYSAVPDEQRKAIREKFALPSEYILYVSTIEPRKNLLNIIKAKHEHNLDIPVVAIGRQTDYAEIVKKYIADNNIRNIFFLKNVSNQELPAIYQMASVFVYPSTFEGFGLPILEALNSRIPVVTSVGSCFHEVGGRSSLYVDPHNIEELAAAIRRVLSDQSLRRKMIDDGLNHASNFLPQRIAESLMNVYKKVL